MHWMILLGLVACNGLAPIPALSLSALSPAERAEVELGRALFFDPGLSANGEVACATCHRPGDFGAEPLATSVGIDGAVLRRNAPSVFNAALKTAQFWDGRATSLEEQALAPLLAADEMGRTEESLQALLDAEWTERFAEVYDEPGPTVDQLTRAVAAYERMLPAPSAFDRFLEGERDALSDEARRGLRRFRTSCAFCHGGPGLGGEQFERLGDERPWPADRQQDRGLEEITGDPSDRMVFVVPSLRNVSRTGPWFHDGSVETLEEAVVLMGRHQLDQEFDDTEVAELVAFLESLEAESVPEWAWPPDAR